MDPSTFLDSNQDPMSREYSAWTRHFENSAPAQSIWFRIAKLQELFVYDCQHCCQQRLL
uniref:Uncharacterized protein n=1 Tax=Romanomermis culicivorax TaxID=13658 RepID=A0A915L3X5_ROMCU